MLSLLASCSDSGPTETTAPVRPVKIFAIEGSSDDAVRKFPGKIDSSQRAELAFRVSGSLKEILVKEGDKVSKDQLLARLDPTDFKIIVQDRQAAFDNADRNFKRATDLVDSGAISRLDFDRMEAEFKSKSAALATAKQDLAYTELKAPFEGQVARRYIDNFEEIQAKQDIFRLQGTNSLDVTIDLSETLIRSLRNNQENPGQAKRDIPMYAEFDDQPGQKFKLSVKEIATQADRETQTFQVRLSMPTPENFTVLPGMTTNVTVDFGQISANTDTVYLVPISAVVANSELEGQLWVLDSDTMQVSSRKVDIGRMSGNSIEVTQGLYGGEEIVSVGAAYLAEGMQVTRMIQTEQAMPRPDDPS